MSYIYNYFLNTVEKFPDKIAIKYGDSLVTYREMMVQVMHISEILRNKGTLRGEIVAIYMTNSIEAVISTLAILKIGGIVLPIDKDMAQDRLEQIILDGKVKSILINRDIESYTDSLANIIKVEMESIPVKEIKNDYTCTYNRDSFCIYTSGSTGAPKGILIKNNGIVNHIKSKIKLLKLNQKSVLCQSLSLSFVASIWQILTPIIIGATLIIYDNETIKNPFLLLKSAEEDEVNTVSIVPQSLKSFLVATKSRNRKLKFKHLKNIILTGEKVDSDLINRFYMQYDAQLINAYGQSECSDDTFHYVIPRNTEMDEIPIGYPIDNISTYILNEEFFEVEKGNVGELYISGTCLSSGYINHNELKNENFIFVEKIGTTLFKTGDLVKKESNGAYVYVGRVDNQIKLKGYRISPEEVECVILEIEEVIKVVVTLDDTGSGEKILVAGYEAKNEIEHHIFTNYLKNKLPKYMIPQKYIYIKKMQSTISGKIDRLGVIRNQLGNTNKLKKRDSIDEKIIKIIKNNIDSYFCDLITDSTDITEIGIDSLNFISIILAIEEEFGFEFEDDMMLVDKYKQVKDFIKYIKKCKENSKNIE